MIQDVLSLLRPHEGRRQTPFAGLSSLLTTSPTPSKSLDSIGVELRHLVDSLAQSGRELHAIADPRLASHIKKMLNHLAALSSRIAVVGQVKAGKSSFLNALMHRGELLPTHVNPWTAVATRLHFGVPGKPISGSDFSFFTAEEWAALGRKSDRENGSELEEGFAEMKSRAELRLGDQFHNLLGKIHHYQSVQAGTLQNYLCAGPPVDEVSRQIKPGRYADITKSANVYFPLPPLAVPATLIDTPGTNDSTHLRYRITREIIEGADIYIVVLTARHPLASSDLGLLKLLRDLEKRHIIVFINRIDEMNERAGDTDVIVQRVKDELDKLFEGTSIAVVAGSAKWAGLIALGDDPEPLRQEARTPAFQAVAARKSLSIPSPDGENGDLDQLEQCFRNASGLESVCNLLGLCMLSGFISNHARGVASVLSEAANISAVSAVRQLRSIARRLRDELIERTQNGGSPSSVQIAEIEKLIDAIEDQVNGIKADCEPAIHDGIACLEAMLEKDIQSFENARKQPFVKPAAIGRINSGQNEEVEVVSAKPKKDERVASERSDWLTSVRDATVDFLHKAFADSPMPEPVEAKPSSVRRASLTVPVITPSENASTGAGGGRWSEWLANRRQDATKGEELSRIVKQEFASGASRAGRRSLQSFSENSSNATNFTSIEPLMRLSNSFHTLHTVYIGGTGGENGTPAGETMTDYNTSINDACLAIAVYEKVMRQIKAAFTPPETSNQQRQYGTCG